MNDRPAQRYSKRRTDVKHWHNNHSRKRLLMNIRNVSALALTIALSSGAVVGTAHAATPGSEGKSGNPKVTTSELNAVATAAVKKLAAESPFPASSLVVKQVKISKTNGKFALAVVEPINKDTDPASVVLTKVGKTWRVNTYGTAGFDCNNAPLKVLREFKLDVFNCKPTQQYYAFNKAQQKMNAKALTNAKLLVLNGGTSESAMKRSLKEMRLPDYSIAYAARNVHANYFANAVHAADVYTSFGYKKVYVLKALLEEGFTLPQANYGIRHLK